MLADGLGQRLADLTDHEVDHLVLGGVQRGGGGAERVGAGECVASPLALRLAGAGERGGDHLAVGGRRADDDLRLVLR